MDLDALVASLKKDQAFAGAFKGSGQSGNNAGNIGPGPGVRSSTGNGGDFPARRSEMTPRQKVDYIKAHGGGKEGQNALLDLPL